jgi:putative hydrolase of the HAD superfamily
MGMQALFEYLTSQLGVSRNEFQTMYDQARSGVKQRLNNVASSHSRLIYLEQLMIDFNLGFRPKILLQGSQIYWSTFLGQMDMEVGVEEFLLACRQIGAQVAIVTDLTSEIQLRKIVRLGIETYIDYFITSEFIGSDKETMTAFGYLNDLLGESPNSYVWYIGDSNNDAPNALWLQSNNMTDRVTHFSVSDLNFGSLAKQLLK